MNKKISFGLILLFGQLYLIYNGAALFGEEFAEKYNDSMLGYLLFYLAFFDSLVEHPTMNMNLRYAIPRYAVFFVLGIAGVSILGIFQIDIFSFLQVDLEPDSSVRLARGVLLYQILFVSNVEECIFRSIMPDILPSIKSSENPITGERRVIVSSETLSSLAFGAFHFASYYFLSQETGQNLLSLIIVAVFAGFMFQGVKSRFGLPASMGFHAGINIGNLGVF